jgi:hypothetical protein
VVHDDWAWACVRDAVAAWNRRDWGVFQSLHAADVVYESPHSRAVGRSAVRCRFQELVAAVPDVQSSELRMIDNDCRQHRATFECIQTGTLAADVETVDVDNWAPFVVHTTMFVRFDDDGRIAGLRTEHS